MSILRIKRRAAGGAAGAPSTLANAELAYNEQDNVLYYGTGTGGAGGSATQVIAIGGSGAVAMLAGAAFTGSVTGLTVAVDNNSANFATTSWYINQKGAVNPLMNGTAAPGASGRWTPIDHVHPTDTTRSPVASPTFTGRVTLPAGSSTIAGGITLVSGTVKTTPVVGDSGGIEYNGTNVTIINSAAVRKTFAYTDSTILQATNVVGGSSGTIPYQTAANTTAHITAGTAVQVLIGGAVPSWTNISGLSVSAAVTAVTATHVAGGGAGTIPYQTAAGATAHITAGTSAQVLLGGATPAWAALTGITVGTATNATQLGGSAAALYAKLASPTFTGSVNVPTATFGDNSTLAASTAFVQTAITSAVQGLDPKQSVRAASTANIPSLSGTMTVDGIALAVGDRFLVKDQTTVADNGIYLVSATAWTRALDMDNWLEVPGAYVFIEEGTINKDLGFTCTSGAGGTLNTTPITWVQFSSAGSYVAGDGINVSTNIITAVGTANRITVGTGIDIASTYVGQTSITTLGTVATGTWNATVISVAKGGTGLSAGITGLVKGNGTSYMAAVLDTDYINPSSTLDGGTF